MTGAPTATASIPARAIPARATPPRWVTRTTRLLAVAGLLSLLVGIVVVLRDASVPNATGGGVLGAPSFRVAYVDAPSTAYVWYEHGEAVGYSIELSNDGPLPITIEDVPIAGLQDDRRLLHPTEVLVAPEDAAGLTLDSAELAPFEPFRLGAGETRRVVVSGVFYNCAYYTERGMDLFVSQPVTWSVAGLATTTEVALTDQVAIRSTFIRECPGRVMDRGARTRTDG